MEKWKLGTRIFQVTGNGMNFRGSSVVMGSEDIRRKGVEGKSLEGYGN